MRENLQEENERLRIEMKDMLALHAKLRNDIVILEDALSGTIQALEAMPPGYTSEPYTNSRIFFARAALNGKR